MNRDLPLATILIRIDLVRKLLSLSPCAAMMPSPPFGKPRSKAGDTSTVDLESQWLFFREQKGPCGLASIIKRFYGSRKRSSECPYLQ